MIGKNNARYFDAQGWLYFTKVFDLYYPSYGDTCPPTYSGAIGMTYEQGGGGAGGLVITTREGDPLTLKTDTHHFTAGVSTVEVTSQQTGRVVDEFEKYYRDNVTNPAAPYKSYVIKADNNPDKVNQLTRWMDIPGIRYGKSGALPRSPLRGYDYQAQTVTNVSAGAEDLIVGTPTQITIYYRRISSPPPIYRILRHTIFGLEPDVQPQPESILLPANARL